MAIAAAAHGAFHGLITSGRSDGVLNSGDDAVITTKGDGARGPAGCVARSLRDCPSSCAWPRTPRRLQDLALLGAARGTSGGVVLRFDDSNSRRMVALQTQTTLNHVGLTSTRLGALMATPMNSVESS